ncbi:MAG: S9 family peptidase, partial [Pseudomonadota bacterium]
TRHGITRTDDYAWLRADNWQEVMRDPSLLADDIRDFLEAENAFLEASMADTEDLQKQLFEEMRGRIKEDDSSVPTPDGNFAYATRFVEGGQHPLIVRQNRDGSDERIILDGNALAEGKNYFRFGGAPHAPDHGLIAWSADDTGSEYYTFRFRDMATGQDHETALTETSGGGAWSADGQHFFYVWLDENHRPCKVYRHTVGTTQADDVLIYEEPDPGFFVGVGKTQSGRFILVDSHDHQTSEVRLIEASDVLAPMTLVAERTSEIEYAVEDHVDRLFILTNDKAEDFRIATTLVASPGRENWSDFVPHTPGQLILDHVVYANHHVWLERVDGLPRIMVKRISDGETHEISFAEEAYALGMSSGYEFATTTLRFSYSSPTTPSETYDYDLDTRERTLRKRQEVPSGHKPADYRARRILVPGHDDAQIPVTILHHAKTPLDGTAPCLLYGYGSYGISIPAGFSTSRLSLVDRGVVYAIAHIRGGKDKGFRWYLDGKREKKTNTFKDFVSVADHLANEGMVAADGIVAQGGSAGGMLMGAVVNMRPDRWKGIIAEVPFVDVLNTMLDDTLPLTPPEWPEWGNPIESKEDYETIASYSPYDNVEAVDYPAILAVGGLTDPRVTYWEPAKWVAKLRELRTNDNPLFLKTNMSAGHGGASGRFDSLKEVALTQAFALKIMEIFKDPASG